MNIFWSRLYSAGSHLSFSISPAVNKNKLESMWVLASSSPPGCRSPCLCCAHPADGHLSLRSFSPQGQEGLQWKRFFLEVCCLFRVHAPCYLPSSELARWLGFGVALSCCESAPQVFGVALERDLAASVPSWFSVFLLSELSWWQVKSRLLSTANYILFWLRSAPAGQ